VHLVCFLLLRWLLCSFGNITIYPHSMKCYDICKKFQLVSAYSSKSEATDEHFLPTPVLAVMKQTWLRHTSFPNLLLKWSHTSHMNSYLFSHFINSQLSSHHFILNCTHALPIHHFYELEGKTFITSNGKLWSPSF